MQRGQREWLVEHAPPAYSLALAVRGALPRLSELQLCVLLEGAARDLTLQLELTLELLAHPNPVTNRSPNLEVIERLLVVPTVRRAGAARLGRELLPHPAAASRRLLSAAAATSVVCTG
jgi:hypothetical protein